MGGATETEGQKWGMKGKKHENRSASMSNIEYRYK